MIRKYLDAFVRYGFLVLLIYVPFHIFLSQSLSLVTGGLAAWKIAKDIVLFILVLAALYLVWRQKLKNRDLKILVLFSVVYGAVHLLVWSINPHIYRQTALEGVVYNNRVLLYAVLGMSAVLLNAKTITAQKLIKLTLIISTIVCVLGLLQYVLPKDLLTHVGYSIPRGVKPNFFIDDKPDFPRIMSTLRDPNSLGAFLILPLCLLYGLFVKYLHDSKQRNKIIGLALVHIAALFLTFSRGAWAGALIASVAAVLTMRGSAFKFSRKLAVVGVCIVLVAGFGLFSLRHQRVLENVLRHSDQTTKAKQDSNALHTSFATQSFKKSVKKPLGHGPGTAGIVSIRNPGGGQLTEDYYLQLLYEVGFIGLALFVGTAVYIAKRLRAHNTLLAQALFASFIAYAFMGLLMHIWSNEAVAAQWWLLAGAAIVITKYKP